MTLTITQKKPLVAQIIWSSISQRDYQSENYIKCFSNTYKRTSNELECFVEWVLWISKYNYSFHCVHRTSNVWCIRFHHSELPSHCWPALLHLLTIILQPNNQSIKNVSYFKQGSYIILETNLPDSAMILLILNILLTIICLLCFISWLENVFFFFQYYTNPIYWALYRGKRTKYTTNIQDTIYGYKNN